MRTLWGLTRTTFSIRALPAYLLVIALHVLLRPMHWTHEWFWGIYQYGFVTVLLGPVVAGVGAVDGRRVASQRWPLLTSSRVLRGLLAWWAAVLGPVVLAFAAGLLGVLVVVKAAGTPGAPTLAHLAAAGPPVCLLALQGAIGFALGYWTRSWLAAPAVTIATFLLVLFLYVNGPDQFVIVGGATGSLVGLEPRLSLVAVQCLFFLASAVLALVLASSRHLFNRLDVYKLGSVACVSIVATGLLLHAGGRRFHETGGREDVCVGSAPAVCVAPGYARSAVGLQPRLRRYVDLLHAVPVVTPSRFVQGASPGGVAVGPLGDDVLRGRLEDRRVAQYVVLAYVSKACAMQPGYGEAYRGLDAWLMARGGQAQAAVGEGVPAVLRSGTPAQRRAWVVDAVATLTSCGAKP